jgi:nucleoside-diphosphate-sugar epimerase
MTSANQNYQSSSPYTEKEVILITGAGGFLGYAIAQALIREKGNQIILRSISRGNYQALEELGVKQFQGDISDLETIKTAIDGCHTVFHVAAKAGAWGKTKSYEDINVKGTQNIIDLCLQYGVKALIYTSSPSVVHDGEDIEGKNEEQLPYPTHFIADYPRTKALAEQLVLQVNQSKLLTVALRPHLIWGPGDQHLIPRIKERALRGRLKHLAYDKKVDSIYITDAAQAHICAWQALKNHPQSCAGKAYFISQGEPWKMGELINGILQAIGIQPVYQEISPTIAYFVGFCLEKLYTLLNIEKEPIMTRFIAEQLSTAHWFDITAAQRDLKFQPKYSIAEALEQLSIQNHSSKKEDRC